MENAMRHSILDDGLDGSPETPGPLGVLSRFDARAPLFYETLSAVISDTENGNLTPSKKLAMRLVEEWIKENIRAIKTVSAFMGCDWVDIGCDFFCIIYPLTARAAGLKHGIHAPPGKL